MICLVVLSIKIAAGVLHTAVLVSWPKLTSLVALLLLGGAGWSFGHKLLRLYSTSGIPVRRGGRAGFWYCAWRPRLAPAFALLG
jgi:hypothetical protein